MGLRGASRGQGIQELSSSTWRSLGNSGTSGGLSVFQEIEGIPVSLQSASGSLKVISRDHWKVPGDFSGVSESFMEFQGVPVGLRGASEDVRSLSEVPGDVRRVSGSPKEFQRSYLKFAGEFQRGSEAFQGLRSSFRYYEFSL